jgi:hypothetical protein
MRMQFTVAGIIAGTGIGYFAGQCFSVWYMENYWSGTLWGRERALTTIARYQINMICIAAILGGLTGFWLGRFSDHTDDSQDPD